MSRKVLLTGGGTGGHVYPLLAVADKLREMEHGIDVNYMGPYGSHFKEFRDKGYGVFSITPSKMRRYFSLKNVLDIFKFFISIPEAFLKVFLIMPDLVFSKGGPGSLPVVIAARFYFIPVIIHESDIVPSLNSRLAAKVAKRVGVSFEETVSYFPADKVFLSGNPVREELLKDLPDKESAKIFWGFNPNDLLIFVMGGSQGSVSLNDLVSENFKTLTDKFQVLHQTGKGNLKEIEKKIKTITERLSDEEKSRYNALEVLSAHEMKEALVAADVVISRAGSGSIFEIAAFGKPSILIPLDGSANDHQLKNAYAYEDAGATVVLEQPNLKIHLVLDRLFEIINNKDKTLEMSEAAKRFSRPEAAKLVADEIVVALYGSDAVKFQILTENDIKSSKKNNDTNKAEENNDGESTDKNKNQKKDQ